MLPVLVLIALVGVVVYVLTEQSKIKDRLGTLETSSRQFRGDQNFRYGKNRQSGNSNKAGLPAEFIQFKTDAEKRLKDLEQRGQYYNSMLKNRPIDGVGPASKVGPRPASSQPISAKPLSAGSGGNSQDGVWRQLADDYNNAKNTDGGRKLFSAKYHETVRFDVDNANERTANKNVHAVFVTKTGGNYLAVQCGDIWCVVPDFDALVNTATYNAGALSDVFDCRGFDLTNTSAQPFRVRQSAVFEKKVTKTWELVSRGTLEFSANG